MRVLGSVGAAAFEPEFVVADDVRHEHFDLVGSKETSRTGLLAPPPKGDEIFFRPRQLMFRLMPWLLPQPEISETILHIQVLNHGVRCMPNFRRNEYMSVLADSEAIGEGVVCSPTLRRLALKEDVYGLGTSGGILDSFLVDSIKEDVYGLGASGGILDSFLVDSIKVYTVASGHKGRGKQRVLCPV